MLKTVVTDIKIAMGVLSALAMVQGQVINALQVLGVNTHIGGDVFTVLGGIGMLLAALLQVAENIGTQTKA